MKRLVAVCLLIVCLVLPLTSIAGFCPKCGKSHAVAVVFYSYTQQNNTYHTVTAEAYLYCPDCKKGVRVKAGQDGDKKIRVCAKCGHKFN